MALQKLDTSTPLGPALLPTPSPVATKSGGFNNLYYSHLPNGKKYSSANLNKSYVFHIYSYLFKVKIQVETGSRQENKKFINKNGVSVVK